MTRTAQWISLVAVVLLASCSGEDLPGRAFAPPVETVDEGKTTLLHPEGHGKILTEQRGINGERAVIACSACHTLHNQAPVARGTDDLDLFHKNLVLRHGGLSCASCHDAANKDHLQLADGRTMGFEQVMDLCGQCHGSQRRDFELGAHGGMNGHWDKRLGDRTRNSCVTCHAPHDPAYPTFRPVFTPRDRFLDRPGETHSTEGAH